jgi:hypothetical protein
MEIEYFFNPKEKWEPMFENWLKLQEEFIFDLGAGSNVSLLSISVSEYNLACICCA